MKGGNIKIFKKSIRQRRAISSNILENGSCNGSEEERNKSNNGIKAFHRKTTTSYFYGSYLSSNLENDLLNNLNIDEINNKYKDNESYTLNEKEKNKILNVVNQINSNNNTIKEDNYDQIFNVSFHSYELDNSNSHNNSVIVKSEEKLNNTNKSNKNNDDNSKTTDNNGKIIIDKNTRNDGKLLLNEKDKKFNTEKSFVSFKNNLKFIKDKEERVTNSYLLALGMTTNQNKKEKMEEKEQYMPTSSVIEEEKSDLIDSKSEFSNKKKNTKNTIFYEDSLNVNNNDNNKKRIMLVNKDNKIKILNILENEKKEKINENGGEKNNFINVNRNNKNIIGKRNDNILKDKEKLSLRMSIALNEIINKNNKKEENKRKYLKKNKTILLNSFFNLTYKGKKTKNNEINNYNQKNESNTDIFKKTDNNIIQDKKIYKKEIKFPFVQKRKKENSNISSIIKIRYNTDNSDSTRTYNGNTLRNKNINSNPIYNGEYQNRNNNTNVNNGINSDANIIQAKNKTFIIDENRPMKNSSLLITKIELRPKSRIPHIRQKIVDKKEIYYNNKNNINNYTMNKNSAPNRKYLTKIVNIPHKKTHSFTKDKTIFYNRKDKYDINSLKQIKTINQALALIRIDRMNSKKNTKSNSKKPNLSFIRNKNSNSSSFTRATRSNSNSKSSRSKEKKILVNKTNSGSLNYKNELSLFLLEDNNNNINTISNKKHTIITLKENLIYSKSYMKINVLEKISKTFNSDNSFFVLYCEKYIKVDNDKDKGIDNNCNNCINNKNDFILLFKSLMKYYHNQNRFIKIYGEENAPNVISVKNININNYFIYRTKYIEKKDKDKNKNDASLLFESIKELQVTTNAIILCKK